MAIVINGSGTVTGLAVGGLPDGTVDAGTLATNSVDSAELVNGSVDAVKLASGVGGKVLQVVSASGGGVVNSSSNSFVDTGLSAAITPSATSSKILVFVDQHITSGAAANWTGFGIFRGSSSIKDTSYIQRSGGGYFSTQVASHTLDSPNTTSATTYKTMFKASSGTAAANDNSAPSTITLIEIGA